MDNGKPGPTPVSVDVLEALQRLQQQQRNMGSASAPRPAAGATANQPSAALLNAAAIQNSLQRAAQTSGSAVRPGQPTITLVPNGNSSGAMPALDLRSPTNGSETQRAATDAANAATTNGQQQQRQGPAPGQTVTTMQQLSTMLQIQRLMNFSRQQQQGSQQQTQPPGTAARPPFPNAGAAGVRPVGPQPAAALVALQLQQRQQALQRLAAQQQQQQQQQKDSAADPSRPPNQQQQQQQSNPSQPQQQMFGVNAQQALVLQQQRIQAMQQARQQQQQQLAAQQQQRQQQQQLALTDGQVRGWLAVVWGVLRFPEPSTAYTVRLCCSKRQASAKLGPGS